MKRLVDGLLIVLALGAIGLGAYAIGHKVDHESKSLASQDSELNGTTTVAGDQTHTTRSHKTPIIVGVALGGAVVLLLLGSGVSAISRARRREHWRAG
jgi:hypothetical protein